MKERSIAQERGILLHSIASEKKNPTGLKVAPFHAEYPYLKADAEQEKQILADYNNQVIHTSPEYQSNLSPYTPTNRILTSMCCPKRSALHS